MAVQRFWLIAMPVLSACLVVCNAIGGPNFSLVRSFPPITASENNRSREKLSG